MARGWLQDAGGGEAGSKRTKGVDDEWTDNLNKRNSTLATLEVAPFKFTVKN